MRVTKGLLVLVVLAWSSIKADPANVCDPQTLVDAYNQSQTLQAEYAASNDACLKQGSCAPLPDVSAIQDNKIRFKLCGDAGSAAGAFLYAQWLIDNDLVRLRTSAKGIGRDPTSIPGYETLTDKAKRRLQRAFGPDPAAQAKVPVVAAEALGYFQKSYRLDPNQPWTAVHIGDLLVSGDVGAGRNFEALDWYYKAGAQHLKANDRDLAVGVFEKMATIDRENPLTEKLEAQIYK
jgi:hypothetical protein